MPSQHQLLAPGMIRSQVLDAWYESFRIGRLSEEVCLDRLARFATMKIRLLGDKVLRRTAWNVARHLERDSTRNAEYVALAQLQADALVTLDVDLASEVEDIVDVAGLEVLMPSGRDSAG